MGGVKAGRKLSFFQLFTFTQAFRTSSIILIAQVFERKIYATVEIYDT